MKTETKDQTILHPIEAAMNRLAELSTTAPDGFKLQFSEAEAKATAKHSAYRPDGGHRY